MLVMNLPNPPVGPDSVEGCVEAYLNRLQADDALWPRVSLLLTAYMAWPSDEPKRDSFVATYLARFIQNSAGETSRNETTAHEASILKAVWIAPDAVLALAAGFQEFGLQPKGVRKESPILRQDKLWRVPPELLPNKPFVVSRLLTEGQLEYLRTRRASKKYVRTAAPVRGRR